MHAVSVVLHIQAHAHTYKHAYTQQYANIGGRTGLNHPRTGGTASLYQKGLVYFNTIINLLPVSLSQGSLIITV